MNNIDKEQIKQIESSLIESVNNRENTTKENLQLAEQINFKALPDKIVATDQFGVLQPSSCSKIQHSKEGEEKKKKADSLRDNARIEKWNVMMNDLATFTTSKFAKLKSRTRKGVPDSLRVLVWQTFGDVSKYKKAGVYQKYLDDKTLEFDEATIIKDLDRTFPNILFFKEKYGSGQRSLYHVLTAYAKFNKETGYVQGMGYITAMLLTYMDEENAFFFLHSLMKKYNMDGFYKQNFPELNKTFYVMMSLMKKCLPKVYAVMIKTNALPSMYASEWFITIFSKELPFSILVRILDVFLLEGFKVMYRFVLAFMKLNEAKIVACEELVGLLPLMKGLFKEVDINKLFDAAFGFSISREQIKKIEAEYDKEKNNKKNEIIELL